MLTKSNAEKMKIDVTVTAVIRLGLGLSKSTLTPGGGCRAGVDSKIAGSVGIEAGNSGENARESESILLVVESTLQIFEAALPRDRRVGADSVKKRRSF